MSKNKLIDCITFFDNNLMFELRFNILKDFMDFFVVCESKYDHRNNKKKLNFDKSYLKSGKVKYLVLENPFPKKTNLWENQAIQREFLLNGLKKICNDDDYIFFSDPDEIPNPISLHNFKLNKKYAIFLQKCFNYKFNLFNPYESPWEGTRVCKKIDLKSIDFMRQKVKSKNLKYSFLRFDKEKNIELINDGGWHFNNLMDPNAISLKLKTFAHSEFNYEKFTNPEIIKAKIEKKIDLFDRGHQYRKVNLDTSFPEFIVLNYEKYKSFIL